MIKYQNRKLWETEYKECWHTAEMASQVTGEGMDYPAYGLGKPAYYIKKCWIPIFYNMEKKLQWT